MLILVRRARPERQKKSRPGGRDRDDREEGKIGRVTCEFPFVNSSSKIDDKGNFEVSKNHFGVLIDRERDIMSKWNTVWNGPASTVFVSDESFVFICAAHPGSGFFSNSRRQGRFLSKFKPRSFTVFEINNVTHHCKP